VLIGNERRDVVEKIAKRKTEGEQWSANKSRAVFVVVSEEEDGSEKDEARRYALIRWIAVGIECEPLRAMRLRRLGKRRDASRSLRSVPHQ